MQRIQHIPNNLEIIRLWYLFGVKFLVKTDHNNLKYFLNQKSLSPEHQKWVRKFKFYILKFFTKREKKTKLLIAYQEKKKGMLHYA